MKKTISELLEYIKTEGEPPPTWSDLKQDIPVKKDLRTKEERWGITDESRSFTVGDLKDSTVGEVRYRATDLVLEADSGDISIKDLLFAINDLQTEISILKAEISILKGE